MFRRRICSGRRQGDHWARRELKTIPFLTVKWPLSGTQVCTTRKLMNPGHLLISSFTGKRGLAAEVVRSAKTRLQPSYLQCVKMPRVPMSSPTGGDCDLGVQRPHYLQDLAESSHLTPPSPRTRSSPERDPGGERDRARHGGAAPARRGCRGAAGGGAQRHHRTEESTIQKTHAGGVAANSPWWSAAAPPNR